MIKSIAIFIFTAIIAACSSSPYIEPKNPEVVLAATRIDLNNTTKIKAILNEQHKDWHRVDHSTGGLSKNGIDCSGLVYRTYREKFGIDVPRSTEHQSKAGRSVEKSQLKAGDMVFFKTGLFKRHVGMYIEKSKFLHVSSSKGVMVSNLNNTYWKEAYWQTRRLN
jgi:cell wall-associated NlpC family hydrolase